jgi:sec-independent protein translocase protein TatA
MFAIFGLGPQEILLLVVAGVLLFGRKLPDIGSSLGKTIVSFRRSMQGIEDDIQGAPATQPIPALPQPVATATPRLQENP